MTITSIQLATDEIRAREERLAERRSESVSQRAREIREERYEEQARTLGAILTSRGSSFTE